MTEDEKLIYWLRRVNASMHRALTAKEELTAEVIKTSAAFREFGRAVQGSCDQEIYEHPDLMHWDVQMDGFYK